MKSLLLVTLLVLELGFAQPTICLADHHPSQLKISNFSIKSNDMFTFKISNHASKTNIIRNSKGTFFSGDFSTLQLMGYNQMHNYQGKSFSFKYPAQHKIADLSQPIIQMQIIYHLKQQQKISWKHKRLALSVSFFVTDYAPDGGFTLKQQIKPTLKNGTIISLQKLLPLVSGLNMILYKGTHSQFPDDRSFLWLVRRELLLMSENEFQTLKDFIYAHIQKQNVEYHGLLQRLSDLNQIREAQEFETVIVQNKQQLQNL